MRVAIDFRHGRDTQGMPVTFVNERWWKTLCSYTHTGYRQIGARLTPEGLGSNYHAEEIELVLKRSCLFSLLAVIEYAKLANDEALAVAVLEKMKALNEPLAP